jgi:hypothetical protein
MVGILLAEKALLKSPYVKRYANNAVIVFDENFTVIPVYHLNSVFDNYNKKHRNSQDKK